MQKYLTLLKTIINKGTIKKNRTSIDSKSIFGYRMKLNLNDGFPLLTTKKCSIKSIIYELLWFLRGDTNTKYLKENNVSIWNNWEDINGNLGPIYGKQWRKWKTYDGKYIDQINEVIHLIMTDPNSRRMVVSAWNVAEIKNMSLPPCHLLFQFYVDGQFLSCQLYQRSCDVFLGLPFNLASYSLLMHMIAQQCNLRVGNFLWIGGDVHLYVNHINLAKIQLSRKPTTLPNIVFNRKPCSISDYQFNDFKIINYYPHPVIKAEIAI
ncbi:thymidylate synthase [Buchnera aphidicola]|uniref:Thymidylate synthase n=1 Tax=Buchnera aphidicola (Anoecia oenotherae) TaxID=1241833 RepID=A0A4D6Y4W2_9GAMM|nr:thymidylate synthase [Buchnera aphidicola]QCI19455.1 thymidylate synthase [Buchnera aphidicola (Anoecia oenotherae)]